MQVSLQIVDMSTGYLNLLFFELGALKLTWKVFTSNVCAYEEACKEHSQGVVGDHFTGSLTWVLLGTDLFNILIIEMHAGHAFNLGPIDDMCKPDREQVRSKAGSKWQCLQERKVFYGVLISRSSKRCDSFEIAASKKTRKS